MWGFTVSPGLTNTAQSWVTFVGCGGREVVTSLCSLFVTVLKRADASGIRSFLTFPFLMQEYGLSSSWASSWLTLQEYCDVSSAAPVYSSKAAAPLAASFERDLRRLHRILGLPMCRCGFCRAGLPYWLHHFCFLVLRDFCPSFPSPFCYPAPVYRRHLSVTNGRKSMDKRVCITLGPLFPLFVKAEMQGI